MSTTIMKIVPGSCIRLFSNAIQSLKGRLLIIIAGLVTIFLTACEKDFDISVKANQPLLVVEGYINNEMPQLNYVVLSRSMDYYSPNLQSTAIAGATVTITEGTLAADKSYTWNPATKVQLYEANSNVNSRQVPTSKSQAGLYFDPRLVTDSAHALKGKTGKYYLLEIEADGQHYSAITIYYCSR